MNALNACGRYVLAGVTALAALAALASLGTAHAGVTVLYAFKGGNDGASPNGLIEDAAGNLYGTTAGGGGGGCENGCGTVFKLAPDGAETLLYSFADPSDGERPSGLIQDSADNLYGTTWSGGGGTSCHGSGYGCGTAFKLAPDGAKTVLHVFAGGSDGGGPNGLIEDAAGNMYGTTYSGGGSGCEMGYGCGAIFRLAPDGKETVLYSFGEYDGHHPAAGLIRDKEGNLYGTTQFGGRGRCSYYGCGTVFKLAPDGTETVLYAFTGGSDGGCPAVPVSRDKAGNLYGTTAIGGATGSFGTAFKLAPDGAETVLHAFRGRKHGDGDKPGAGVIRDRAGAFYGTTTAGGGGGCELDWGCGTVFRLAPDGVETVLYAFGKHRRHGAVPEAGLIEGADGRLYGTASQGGDGAKTDCKAYGCGTVFGIEK